MDTVGAIIIIIFIVNIIIIITITIISISINIAVICLAQAACLHCWSRTLHSAVFHRRVLQQ